MTSANIKPSVVIVGSINLDIFVRVDRLPLPGETIISSELWENYGGKGANQAVAVAKLGGRSIMVGKVGQDDTGRRLLENFKKSGVETEHVITAPEDSSGMAFVTLDCKGENMIVVHSGANSKLGLDEIERAKEAIQNSRVVVAQLETPIPIVAHAAKVSREYGVPFILNPAPAPSEDISGILKNTDILCPNRSETERLIGNSINNINDAFKAGRKLMETGVKNIVLTLGSFGALLISESAEHHFPCPNVNVCDSTGAGDAFVGALAYFLAEGKDISTAAGLATCAASLSVTKTGTQTALPTFDEVMALYREYSGAK